MTYKEPPTGALRDKFVWAVCNFVFRLATPFYRNMVAASIEYGLSSAARDSEEGREPPPHWGR